MRVASAPRLAAALLLVACPAPADGDTSATEGDTSTAAESTTTEADTSTSTTAATDTSGGSTTTGDPPPVHDGEPLPPAEPGTWTWVEFPDARCRSGEPTGLGVRYGADDRLLFYFQGGGACFNQLSCATNGSSYDGGDFDGFKNGGGESGIFDPQNPDNPVGDWSFIYIPYCTGDVHSGDNPGSEPPGAGGPQQFVGYRNVEAYLERVYPTFKDADHILVTGESAGGFGAALNYARISDAFRNEVTLLDDSGPPMADMYMAPCLQKQWRDYWGLDVAIPMDCTECYPPDDGGMVNIVTWIGENYPDEVHGLISSEEDSTIRTFYGFGGNNCNALLPTMSGAEYKAGLYDLRDNVLKTKGKWGSFIIPGDVHTWIGGNSYYTTEVGGMLLVDWVTDLLNGSPSHLSP